MIIINIQYVQGECIFTRINKTIKQYEYLTEDIENEEFCYAGWNNAKQIVFRRSR